MHHGKSRSFLKVYDDLSDFMNKTFIKRSGTSATIIVDENNGNQIPLYCFKTSAEYSDFEIYENGYNYYKLLVKHLHDIQRKG